MKGDGSETVNKREWVDASSLSFARKVDPFPIFPLALLFFLPFPPFSDGGKKLRANDGRRALSTRIFRISPTEARYFRCRAQYFRRLSANPLMEPSAGLHRSASLSFVFPYSLSFVLLSVLQCEMNKRATSKNCAEVKLFLTYIHICAINIS